MRCCPTCGGPISIDTNLVVDLNSNTVMCAGQAVRVQPKLAEMLHALDEVSPRPLPDDMMILAMWGDHDDGDFSTRIRVYVSRARTMLEPLGLSIERVSRRGYRLFRDTPAGSRAP